MYKFIFDNGDEHIEVCGADRESTVESIYELFRAFLIANGFAVKTVDSWMYTVVTDRWEAEDE